MSQYVIQMKDTLVSFNTTAKEIREQATEGWQIALQSKAEEAKSQIGKSLENALEAAYAWASLDAAEIDHEDLFLLQGMSKLTQKEIRRLLVKHQNNGTMVNAIGKVINSGVYCTTYREGEKLYIPNLQDKEKAYKHFAEYANTVIKNITDGARKYGDELQHWADPETIGEEMTAIIYGIN